jgi:hypothetical protein
LSTLRRSLLLAGVSVVTLAAQVTLTRLFSVVFWYHFGFLILSTSLLGFAIGGLVVRALGPRLERVDPDRLLAGVVAGSGPLLALALYVVTHTHFSPTSVHQSVGDAIRLIAVSVALIPPFVALGGTVLYMLQRWSESVDRMYAANLFGSGLGCLAALLLLDSSGGLVAYVVLAASLPAMAAWYAFPISRRMLGIALVSVVAVLATLGAPSFFYPLHSPTGKPVACQHGEEIVFSDWTSLSKLDICDDKASRVMGWGLWGMSRVGRAELPERLGVVIDYWAYTTIIKDVDRPGYDDFYQNLPMYSGYAWLDEPRVLVIGSGGGMDVRAALVHGAREVDAVEINPSIYRAMTEDLAEYSGNIYTRPGVNAYLAEGRRFVESSDTRWDMIQISGVDTHSATQAGAFALSENFLYTKEAIASYFEHLEDDGLLTLTRWYMPSESGEPRFSLRLFTLAIEALADQGYENPGEHVLFFRSRRFTVMLIRNSPIGAEQIAAIERVIDDKGYQFIYSPDREIPEAKTFYEYLRAPDRGAWIGDYRFNVSPPTDDSPFFFEHRKLRDILRLEQFLSYSGLDGQMILVILLVEMLLAGVVLLFISRRLDGERWRPAGCLYFTAIGLGFMLVEVTLSQRLVLFLGHPVYALSVVLFTLLVFSGIGAQLSTRLSQILPVRIWLLAIAVMMALWALFGTPLLRSMIGMPTLLRMGIAVALLAPAAVLMGTAFPEAVRRLTASGEQQLGVYWAWNGVASVTASVLAVLVAMGSGFGTVMWIAAAAYAVAALVLPSLSKGDAG